MADDVVEHLRTNETLDDRVRAVAIRLAKAHKQDPDRLNDDSWKVVKAPDGTADEYSLALRRARALYKIAPDVGYYVNTLGVAQYRVGNYEDALVTLARSDTINGGIPSDVAFIAMAHHHLGHADEARARP